ncbi:MAG TPA: hypothetical protein PLL10_01230 [Elusimicrobiales bacterium]|nr:hypothetical protein [Elusimicrobiales bacterium]
MNETLRLCLYLASLILTAVAGGAIAYNFPRHIPLTRNARFLAGAALAPYLIGFWAGPAILLLPKGLSSATLLLPPLAALLAAIILRRRLASACRGILHTITRRTDKVLLICAFAVIAAVALKLGRNAAAPVDGYDALSYMQEAIATADNTANAENFLFKRMDYDKHNYVWPSYLSYAFLWGEAQRYPADLPARLAFQLPFLGLMLSIFVLAAPLRTPGLGLFTLFVFLLVPSIGHIPLACDREAFALIPLLLLAASLLELSPAKLKNTRRGTLCWFFLLALAAISGHTLGAIWTAILCAAWTLSILRRGASLVSTLAPLLAAAAGLVAGGLHYLIHLLTFNKFT